VEVKYDQASSDPGQFANQGTWKNFIQEFLTASRSHIGTRTLLDIRRLVIFSHSGAYLVTGKIATQQSAGETKLRQVVLLDSLYGSFNDFTNFITSHMAMLGNSSLDYQYTNVWTDHGGTDRNSIAEAIAIGKLMRAANKGDKYFWDNTTATLPPSIYRNFPVIFKHSAMTHDGVPTYYFEQLLNQWGL